VSKEGSLALCILICVQLNQKGVLLSHCIVNSPATAWMHPIWLIANILPLPPTAKPKLKVCTAESEVSCVVRQVSRHTTKAQCISLAQARPFPFRSADHFQQGYYVVIKYPCFQWVWLGKILISPLQLSKHYQ